MTKISNFAYRAAFACVLMVAASGTFTANAETGLAPVGPGGTYASLHGGYLHQNWPKINGHNPSVYTNSPIKLGIQNGGYFGGSLGFVLGSEFAPVKVWSNPRIEASFTTHILKDANSSDTTGSITAILGNTAAQSLINPASSKLELRTYDASFAFKGDMKSASGIGATNGIELFVRNNSEKMNSYCCTGNRWRKAKVNSWFFGAMAVLQPEVPIGGGLSFVADLGAGAYVFNADGRFGSHTGVVQSSSDHKSKLGFRGRASGGLKYAFAPGITGTFIGGIDHWSAVPYAAMPGIAFTGDPSSHIGLKSLTELKTGLRITFALGRIK